MKVIVKLINIFSLNYYIWI